VQVQNPPVQVPLAPHWLFVEHVPQVPCTHAMPPPHWALAVQLVQVPLMHAYPGGGCGLLNEVVLHWAKLEHGPHVLLTQASPFVHPKG
jgi:hypothetical protein